TDARGHCVKNGLHCAFAHGPLDLRPPVCDIRELQAQEALQNGQLSAGDGVPDLQPGVLASQALMEKILGEDPRWQGNPAAAAGAGGSSLSVKSGGETEAPFEHITLSPSSSLSGPQAALGEGPARLAQLLPGVWSQSQPGPQQPPQMMAMGSSTCELWLVVQIKFRSTPCPSVKHGDEWGEPSRCESGDSCQYCHSRTEQQFHPEIYKSTKCNDMRQTGHCPRGPFCAFAHVESEYLGAPGAGRAQPRSGAAGRVGGALGFMGLSMALPLGTPGP
ncbi:hypothetical protein E2I00_009268, partial [Balaenoptera physalus]